MPSISKGRALWTVIVTVDAAPEEMDPFRAHAADGLTRFQEYAGFVGGALHVSRDGSRLVQYVQWTSEAAYEACIGDPAWDALPSTQRFLDAAREGRVRVDARGFEVVESVES